MAGTWVPSAIASANEVAASIPESIKIESESGNKTVKDREYGTVNKSKAPPILSITSRSSNDTVVTNPEKDVSFACIQGKSQTLSQARHGK